MPMPATTTAPLAWSNGATAAAVGPAILRIEGNEQNNTLTISAIYRSVSSYYSYSSILEVIRYWMHGRGGNDVLNASDIGDDTLYGGSGNDILNGYGGSDRLYGDAGNDTLMGGRTGSDSWGETDLLDGGTGIDTVTYANSARGVYIMLSLAVNVFGSTSDAKGDRYISIENVTGTNFKDFISGDTKANVIRGLGGNDRLIGGGGHDTLRGDDGNDTLSGSQGDDILIGGDGNDVLNGEANADFLLAGDGNDTLNGSTGVDTLYGGNGADVMNGDAGNDILDGGAGTDTLTGGADADSFVLHLNGSVDVITDFFKLSEAADENDRLIVSRAEFGLDPALASVPVEDYLDAEPDTFGPRFLLDGGTSILYFDIDGADTIGSPVAVAKVTGILSLDGYITLVA